MASKDIPLSQINPAHVLLRPVNKASLAYLQIRDTIGQDGNGLLNSICVRPDPREPGKYEVVDGMYRYTAFCEREISSIPCIVRENLTDDECLALQIRANAIRQETTRTEFARQLKRIQKARPGITMSELAVLVGREPQWVSDQLLLLHLIKDARKHLDRDEMCVENAYMLAKIPPNHQRLYLNDALVMPVPEFKTLAATVIRGFMEAARNGRLTVNFVDDFKPTPYLRPLKEVLAERETNVEGVRLMLQNKVRTPLEAWKLCLQWVTSLDPETVAEQKRKADIRLKKVRENHLQDDSDLG